MARQFDVVIERDEEGLYVASVPQLPGFNTDGASLDELMLEIREAIQLCRRSARRPVGQLGIRRHSAGHDRRMSILPRPTGKELARALERAALSKFW